MFEHVTCYDDSCLLFNDSLQSSDISISSVVLRDGDSSFYASSHSAVSDITVNDLVVETSKYWNSNDDNALMSFSSADSVWSCSLCHVHICFRGCTLMVHPPMFLLKTLCFFVHVSNSKALLSGMDITISYDMNDCEYDYTQWTGSWTCYILNSYGGSVSHYKCPNPQTLIVNHGDIGMDDIIIHWNVIESNISVNVTKGNELNDSISFNFANDGDIGFIENYGVMDIHNLTMQDSVARIMFWNGGMFILVNLNL